MSYSNIQYLEKEVLVQLNGTQKIEGILRGYDVFMNITLAKAFNVDAKGDRTSVGTSVIRGNSIVSLELKEK